MHLADIDIDQYLRVSMQRAGDASRPACDASGPLFREPISAATASRLAGVFAALADPVRLRLLSLVACRAGAQVCECDLSDESGLAPSAVLQHLAVLATAGLVAGEQKDGWTFHSVQARALRELAAALNTSANAA
ncbi:ArsR/SmtB family transcription factor [Jiangella anatolica]|nr:metalloregulator ArsR/SmtB family transcription factor [Jiangella anatolica]